MPLNGKPLFFIAFFKNSAFEDQFAGVCQMLGKHVEQRLLARFVMNGGQEIDDIEFFLRNLPPAPVNIFHLVRTGAGLANDLGVGINADDAGRAPFQGIQTKKSFITANIKDGQAVIAGRQAQGFQLCEGVGVALLIVETLVPPALVNDLSPGGQRQLFSLRRPNDYGNLAHIRHGVEVQEEGEILGFMNLAKIATLSVGHAPQDFPAVVQNMNGKLRGEVVRIAGPAFGPVAGQQIEVSLNHARLP